MNLCNNNNQHHRHYIINDYFSQQQHRFSIVISQFKLTISCRRGVGNLTYRIFSMEFKSVGVMMIRLAVMFYVQHWHEIGDDDDDVSNDVCWFLYYYCCCLCMLFLLLLLWLLCWFMLMTMMTFDNIWLTLSTYELHNSHALESNF